jgi:uncharacterized protein (DUF2461 family)
MPPRGSLARIRDALVEDHESFSAALNAPAVRRRFGSLDEAGMLKRMPRGYRDDHLATQYLRHQSFTLGRELSLEEVLAPRLPSRIEKEFRLLLPFVRWLNQALGYPPASSRL